MANNKYIRGLSGRGFRVKNAAGVPKTVKEGAATNTQVDLDAVNTQDILSRERDNFIRVADSTATTAVIQSLHRKGLRLRPAGGTFTVTSATPAVFTRTAHGFVAGDALVLSTTGALYTGLTAGTTYYVIATGLTANAFQVALTPGGTAVNTSGSQSGTHSVAAMRRNVPQNQAITVDLNDGDTKRLLKRNVGRWIVATGDVVNLVGLSDQQASFRVVDPTMTIESAGANNNLTFVPKVADSDAITVAIVDLGVDNATVDVSVTGSAIQVSTEVTQNVFATGVISDTAGNLVDNDTLVVNGVTYRFKNTLAQANDVKIGATSDATLDSFVKAINQTGVVGTDYFAGTTAPGNVTAGARSGTTPNATVTLTATVAGTAGNAIVFTRPVGTAVTISGAGTLTGGVAYALTGTAAEIKAAIEASGPANALVTVTHEGDGSGNVTTLQAAAALGGDPDGIKRGEALTNVDLKNPYNIGQLRRRFKHWVEN